MAVWGLHLWRAKCKSPKCQSQRALLQRGRGGWEGSYRVMAFHCLHPCQERRGVPLLPVGGCCCCNLIYQSYQRLSTGDHMGLLEHSVVVMTALCLGGLCPVQSITDPLSIPGRCSLQVFTPLSQGQYWEVMWLVHGHITRKWQSLESNTGTLPNEAHQVPFLFCITFF